MMNIRSHQFVTLGALVLSSVSANAQIQISPQAYIDEPEIVFSIGEPKSAPLAPQPVVAAPPPIAVKVEVWEIKQSAYMQDILKEWSDRAGWSLVWGLDKKIDYQMNAAHTYKGDYKNAVRMLFDSMPSNMHLVAELRTTNNPPLLFIKQEERSK